MKPRAKRFVANQHLGLAVKKPVVPDFVREAAARSKLGEKSEFHISVVVAKNAKILWREIASSDDPAGDTRSLESLFHTFAWEYEPQEEYFLHERHYTKRDLADNGYGADIPEHTRRSIVQKVSLPDLTSFYDRLDDMFGISLTLPVPHMTLFAWSDYAPLSTRGIGINSQDEFVTFTRAVLRPA